jgi:hypothetical protein
VTGHGVSDGDMPIFPWPVRGGIPPVGDAAFDALLTGQVPPQDAPEGLRPVAEAIAALHVAPTRSELAAEASARAVFRGAVGRSADPVRSPHRSRPVLTSLLSAKLAAAASVAAVALGGTAAAAFTGTLPAPVQKIAHTAIGAPAAHPTAPASPVGPQPTGNAGSGLCTAWTHMKAHGTATQKATAFRNLAAAAGGAANVKTFCASRTHPGPSGQPTSHPTGKPSSHPTGKPSGLPAGQPSPHPTGQPTSLPAGGPSSHPTGKPTSLPTG